MKLFAIMLKYLSRAVGKAVMGSQVVQVIPTKNIDSIYILIPRPHLPHASYYYFA